MEEYHIDAIKAYAENVCVCVCVRIEIENILTNSNVVFFPQDDLDRMNIFKFIDRESPRMPCSNGMPIMPLNNGQSIETTNCQHNTTYV